MISAVTCLLPRPREEPRTLGVSDEGHRGGGWGWPGPEQEATGYSLPSQARPGRDLSQPVVTDVLVGRGMRVPAVRHDSRESLRPPSGRPVTALGGRAVLTTESRLVCRAGARGHSLASSHLGSF